ncbi:MarR family winged helix-turn-helix transcriptional regulator [Hahella ganghwensis]|uniref:MarR family winged helix-turn-helix transcriptional regulator n=1 Tax=Hahella ganghwensis TaxID=286420 RepID=UPI0003752ED0|nr:MarR family transcriptional regulator [Hahella ganghwensis]
MKQGESSLDDKALFFQISVINKAVQRLLERQLKSELDANLSVSHADILMYLNLYRQATVTELREFLGVTKSTMTVLLKKLENLQYIRREVDETDRRKTWIYLRAPLQPKLGKARDIGEELTEQVLKDLTASERKELARLLAKVRAGVEHIEVK